MPVYVTLFKFTDAGAGNIKEVPEKIAEGRKTAEELGGKVLGVYVTMGEYDIVGVTEGPSDEVAATAALSIASKGNAKTTTMRAFTESEFAEIVKKVS